MCVCVCFDIKVAGSGREISWLAGPLDDDDDEMDGWMDGWMDIEIL